MSLNFKRSVIIKTQFEALHQWGNIPDTHPSQYLKQPHRHVFHIEMNFVVNHSDRDIEFIDFKHKVDQFLSKQFDKDPASKIPHMKSTSCENLCELLLFKFCDDGCYKIKVLEDGEMGAIVKVVA